MSVSYGFFNSVNGDRKYDANQFGSIYDGVIENGVFSSIGNKFMVTPAGGLTLKIDTGRSWFNGHWTYNDAPTTLEIPVPTEIYSRYYAVIIDVNEEDRTADIVLKPGAAAVDPIKPAMEHTNTRNQYALAYVLVGGRGATEILPEDIEFVVGTDETPFVTGIIQQASAEDLITNWKLSWKNTTERFEENFNAWFETLQTTLSGDVAGNLYNKIYDLEQLIENLEDAEDIEY